MNKRRIKEINAASMADIAFLLLIFFLSITAIASDQGLARRLPPPVPQIVDEMTRVHERNVMVVLINANNDLMVRGEFSHVSYLREKAKAFIQNANNDPGKPELRDTILPNLGPVRFTRNHVISLQNDRGTEYQAYMAVQNELIAAYNELRNEFALRNFGVRFEQLSSEVQAEIRIIYDQRISEAEPRNFGGN